MYVIASQDQAMCAVYEGDAAMQSFRKEPVKIALEIKALGISLPPVVLHSGVVQ